MRSTTPVVIVMMAAVLLTGCALPARGPDQTERDSWSRVIETAIHALPGVVDASHWFDYEGKSRTYTSRLFVRLEDGATPDEAASVVRAMGAQQLPPRYRGDYTEVDIDRMADSYSASWRFGRDVSREANSAHTWVRVSAPGTQVGWRSRGFDVDQMRNAISVAAGSEAEPHRATAAMRRIIQDFPELAPNDWTVATVPVYPTRELTGRDVMCPRPYRRRGHQSDLGALADNSRNSVTVFFAEIVDVEFAGFEDPWSQQPERRLEL
ncbi:hypothetical protein AB0L57_03610 [Nocardia sp. NPDC052254]|uniref:hypothetical protein n=1 Tax=Nocardia sp. NPDC052254 TaxID=3155681 RepID=UPI00342B96F4